MFSSDKIAHFHYQQDNSPYIIHLNQHEIAVGEASASGVDAFPSKALLLQDRCRDK